ncbi:hypothetical protein C8Q74DRAFT_1366197 [Fomes fomentarius]|nr:hypothetical protein C8Q74DRAFT_1366197 [Fomes fomentarius]
MALVSLPNKSERVEERPDPTFRDDDASARTAASTLNVGHGHNARAASVLDPSLTRSPANASSISDATLIQDSKLLTRTNANCEDGIPLSQKKNTPSLRQRLQHTYYRHHDQFRSAGIVTFCVNYVLGATQALQQLIHILVGYAILHLARPHDSAFDVDITAAVRTAALGGVVLNAIICWPFIAKFALSLLLPNNDTRSDATVEADWDMMVEQDRKMKASLRFKIIMFWVRPAWFLGRAAAAAALGAKILDLRQTGAVPMDVHHSVVMGVVGAAVVYIPRAVLRQVREGRGNCGYRKFE